jgi:hypothetical protein
VAVEVAEERPSPEPELIARQELERVLAAIAELFDINHWASANSTLGLSMRAVRKSMI